MSEEDLQKEWRQIVIDKLNKLDDAQNRTNGILSTFSVTNQQVIEMNARLSKVEERQQSFLAEEDIKREYITKTEFDPIKRVTYGAIGVILIGVMTALIALVIKK